MLSSGKNVRLAVWGTWHREYYSVVLPDSKNTKNNQSWPNKTLTPQIRTLIDNSHNTAFILCIVYRFNTISPYTHTVQRWHRANVGTIWRLYACYKFSTVKGHWVYTHNFTWLIGVTFESKFAILTEVLTLEPSPLVGWPFTWESSDQVRQIWRGEKFIWHRVF